MYVMLHDPELLEAYIEGKSLICRGEGNSRAPFQWIELTNVNYVVHGGHELNMCTAVSFQQWKHGTMKSETDLELLLFQCAIGRGTKVVTVNYTVPVSHIDSICSTTLLTAGA